MTFDFDRIIDRRESDSVKWGKYRGSDVLPMWVADMDFLPPREVISALEARVHHGIFGYGDPTESTLKSVVGVLAREHSWQIESRDLVWLPGLVVGLHVACQALTNPDEAVVTASPIYPPFLAAPLKFGRGLIDVPLSLVDSNSQMNGRWGWDFDRLQSLLANAHQSKPRLLLLCNPHNPIGRVWTRKELERLLNIAVRHDLLVCSDEVHCDLLLEEGQNHIPFATLGREAAERTVTLMSPSKTYNLAGLGCAFAITQNEGLRSRLESTKLGIVPRVNVLGFTACEASYRYGQTWRMALLSYLRGNRDRAFAVISRMPGLKAWNPEATYLMWIDATTLCAERGIADPVAFFEAAGVGLSDGKEFGAPGFVRLNFGCPRATLELALERMRQACELKH